MSEEAVVLVPHDLVRLLRIAVAKSNPLVTHAGVLYGFRVPRREFERLRRRLELIDGGEVSRA